MPLKIKEEKIPDLSARGAEIFQMLCNGDYDSREVAFILACAYGNLLLNIPAAERKPYTEIFVEAMTEIKN